MKSSWFAVTVGLALVAAIGLGAVIGIVLRSSIGDDHVMLAACVLAGGAATVSWMGYRTWIHPRG